MIKYIKNLHRSANIFYESKINLQQHNVEYKDLLPTNAIQNGSEYLYAMRWAFKNKRVKNIALAGPYGAGKSSVIESFLKKHWRIKRKALRISMASFEINDESSASKRSKTPVSKEEVEHGILKQLFYKVGYRKIPQSRYRKLHKISAIRTWITLFLISLLTIPFLYIFKKQFFTKTIENIITTGRIWSLSKYWSIGIFVALVLVTLGLISYAYKSLLSRYRIRKVSLPADTVVEGDINADEPVFSKYLDSVYMS